MAKRKPSNWASLGKFSQHLVGPRLDALRRRRGWKVPDISKELGWDKSEWSRKTRGITPMYLWEASLIAELLDADPGEPFVDRKELRRIVQDVGESVSTGSKKNL